jgi:hypothetical protein
MADQKHSVEWTLKVGTAGGPEVAALKAELEKLGRIDAFAKLKKQTEESEKAWQAATSRVATMANELKSAEKPTKKMAQDFERAKIQAGRLKDQFEQQRLSLHKLRGELGQAGVNTTKLASAQQTTLVRVAALKASLQASNVEMARTKDAAGTATAGLGILRSGIGGVQSVLAGLMRFAPGGIAGILAGVTGGAVAGKAMEYAKISAEYDTMGVAMYVIGRNAGYTRKELDEVEKSLRKSGISMQESRKNIAKLVSAKIDLSKATTLARIAQDAAIPAQLNSSEAFGHLVDGIQSAQVEMLRTLGINVSFEQSYRDMAKELDKSATELTEAEKMQARLSVVIKAATGIAGTYEESLGTVGKKISSLARLEEDAKTKIGSLFTPVLAARVDLYTLALQKLNAQMDKILSSSEQGVKRSPLFSDGAAATGPLGATIVGLFKLREHITERKTLEKEALEKQMADEMAAKKAMAESERAYAAQVRAIQSELSKFRDTEWDKIEKDIKAHIKDLISEEERYADRVKTLDEKRRMANLSTEEKIRSMLRGTMTEYQAYRDKQAEAHESLSKARQALIAGDGGGAEFWAKKAQDQFADLNDEVRDGERVIISRAQAQATAIQGVREAGQALNNSLLEQRRAEDAGHNARMQQIGEAKTALQNLKTVQENIGDIETLLTVKDGATPTLENVQKAAEKLTEIKMQIGAIDGVTSVVQSAQSSLDSLPESTTVIVSAQDNATGPVRLIEAETGRLLTNKTMQVNAQDNATGPVRLIETETGLLLTNKSMDVSAQDKATEQVRIIEAETGKLITNKVMDVEVRGNATEEIDEVIDKVEDVPAAKSTTVTANDRASAVLERIKSDLAQIRDKTVTVTVRYRRVGSSDGLASGGLVPGYAFGGRLPGYSLRDNLLGLIGGKQPIGLAGGEDVTNARSSRVIYNAVPWLMPHLNRVRTTADLSRIIAKLQTLPMRGYAEGGRVVEEFRATFGIGGKQASMTTRSRSEFEGAKALARELGKLQLVKGGQ